MLDILLYCLELEVILGAIDTDFPFVCGELPCIRSPYNSKCDPLCMNPSCNYDSANKNSLDWNIRFYGSNCYLMCLQSGCDIGTLTETCDPLCDIPECGYGLGACGYCGSGCSKKMLLNGICDPECNNRGCIYDNHVCGWCAPNCFKEDLDLPYCKEECDVPDCYYPNSACGNKFCAPGCSRTMLTNSVCDPECNNEKCNYDDGLCFTCTYEKLNSKICYPECSSKEFSFQYGVCGYCNSGCFSSMLENYICEPECNVKECFFDGGDCGCAEGCSSIYNFNSGEWEWDIQEDGCKAECLVEDCLYNYQVCKDSTKIRAAWIQQTAKNDFGHVLSLSECYKNHPECTKEVLWEIDQTETCVEVCNNADCLYCMGISNNLLCKRSMELQCLICSGSKQVYGTCLHSTSCPPGFSFFPELSDAFFGAEICLPDPNLYNEFYPFTVYVNQLGDDDNDGSEYFPVRSLSVAMQLCTRKYNRIEVSNGRHNFTRAKQVNPLSSNPFSPLEMITNLLIKSIQIVGEWATKIYLVEDNMKIKTESLTLSIEFITFDGRYALSRYCDKSTCQYCPAYVRYGNTIFNDRNETIYNIDDYALNCSIFSHTDFISVPPGSTLNFYGVDVVNFRQQLRTFIYSEGNVLLKYVRFDKIQNYKDNYFITANCLSKCTTEFFSMQNALLMNFNSGYEYSKSLIQPGFLKVKNFQTASILSLQAYSVMAILGNSTSRENSLFEFENILGNIYIISSYFSNVFVNKLINIDSSTLTYQNLYINPYEFYPDTFLNRITFGVIIFENVNSVQCLICILKGTVTMFAKLDNIEFLNISIVSGGVISISSVYEDHTLFEDSKIIYFILNKEIKKRWIWPEIIELTNLKFKNIFYKDAVISIKNQHHVLMKKVLLTNLHGFDLNFINSFILRNPNNKLKIPLTSSVFPNSSCYNIISFVKVNYIQITDFEASSINCIDGNSGLKILYSRALDINNFVFDNLIGFDKSYLIYLFEVKQIYFYGCIITNIAPRSSTIFKIMKSVEMKLINFIGQSLLSFNQPCLSFEKFTKINITSFSCIDCGSNYADGGVLFIVPDTINSEIYIKKFTCYNCYSRQGFGGAISFNSYSGDLNHNLNIIDSIFSNCSAIDGASVHISNKFSVSVGNILNMRIRNSAATNGSVFADYHSQGLISISNSAFENNGGHYSGIKVSYINENSMLNLSNILILNSRAELSVFNFESNVKNALVTFTLVFAKSSASKFVIAKNIRLSIDKLSIDSGQGIFLDSVVFYGQNMTFNKLNGHAISSSNSSIVCINFNNSYSTADSVLLIEDNSTFIIENAILSHLSSSGSSVVLSMTGCPGQNIFRDSSINYCSSKNSPLMSIKESNLTLNSCMIGNNTSSGIISGISILFSKLHLINSTFYNQKSTLGGFIYLFASNLIAYNSTFNQGEADKGGAIFSTLSTVEILLCSFINNKNTPSDGKGGALYGINTSNFTIHNSIFTENTSQDSGSSIYFSGTILQITNTDFTTSNGTSVIISLSNIESFTFDYSTITGIGSIGVFSVNTKNFSVSHSQFSNLSGAIRASAMRFTESSVFALTDCKFINNSAVSEGGALDLNGVSLILTESVFEKNSAELGGAINFICPDLYCTFNITNSTFSYNKAQKEGGAMKWADKKPAFYNVNFTNNSAPFSSDISSFAAILAFQTGRSLMSIECVPGQVCSNLIQLEIQDTSGKRMIQDSTSTAVISAADGAYSVSGNSKAVAKLGVFTFNNYIISGKPGTEVNITISTSSIDPSKAKKVGDTIDYIDSVSVLVKLRDCVLGEQIHSRSCTVCQVNTYTLDPAPSCSECPVGGNCTGGWKIYPLPGYWKPRNLSDIIYRCSNEEACLGSLNESDFTGSCKNGYDGNKCFGCATGFSKTGTNKCLLCPNNTSNNLIILAIVVFFVFQATILVITTLRSAYTENSLLGVYFKILTNYLQLISLMPQLDLQWPWFVLELFSVQKDTSSSTDLLFSYDCFFQDDESDYSSLFTKKLIAMSILPLIVWLVSLIVWMCISIKNKNWKYLKKEYFTSMIVCFFLIYPSIIKIMFSIFSCEHISGSGYWMSNQLQIKCWGSDYLQTKLVIALPSIIVWVLGVPTLVLVMLYKNRKRMHKDSVRVIFGFFYKGYRHSIYYWEFIIMYRKLLIICIIIFFGQISKYVQALTLVVFLLIFMYLQINLQPYNLHQLNHMESMAIVTSTLTIYSGLYFLARDVRLEVSIILFILIILGNLYFLVYWLSCVSNAVLNVLSDTFYWARKLIHKTDPYPEYVFHKQLAKQGVTKKDGETIYSLFQKEAKNTKLLHINEVTNFDSLQEKVLREYIANNEIYDSPDHQD